MLVQARRHPVASAGLRMDYPGGQTSLKSLVGPGFVFWAHNNAVRLRLAGFCLAAALLSVAMAGNALAGKTSGRSSGHFSSAKPSGQVRSATSLHQFHQGHAHRGHHHHGRVFVGGFIWPAYYPYYYPAPYYAAPPGVWYYCPAYGAYYPYVTECPSGWQTVAPGAY
jgi:hypothetical protein